MAKKKCKHGIVHIPFPDLSCMEMKDMSFWDQFIPTNSEVVNVLFYHDYGDYDEPDDMSISIEWKLKE